jgi:transcriptional regulator with XRE-family HTH domain
MAWEQHSPVDLDGLAALVAGYRRHRDLTLRGAAHECGVSSSTLSRIERGEAQPDLGTVRRLVDWIGVSLERVLPAPLAAPAPRERDRGRDGRGAGPVLDEVAARLRRDPELSPAAAEALIRIVRTAYRELARAPRR